MGGGGAGREGGLEEPLVELVFVGIRRGERERKGKRQKEEKKKTRKSRFPCQSSEQIANI